MASTELLMNRGRDKYRRLSSRASSATLFLGQQVPGHFDGPADRTDMIIAQELLNRDSPRAPRQQSPCRSTRDGPQCHLMEGDEIARDRRLRQGLSSNTWTSSSGAASEEDGTDDRTPFVEEYNRLAKKYGVQPIVPDEFVTVDIDKVTLVAKQGSWIMRKLLRRTSSIQATIQVDKQLRHRRSVSDLSIRLKAKKDALKDKSLLELVRLCGTSALYLPAEYSPSTLAVPTCFRATAQYLVQHAAASRGIFRIPGSHSTINALYNHYASQDDDGDRIRGTVRCPVLPDHINCSVHDVASAFKKFLAGLPGGILGNIWVFESTISIYSHLDAAAEHTRTKQSKIRARLIALAVASIASRHQRELISAVFGLLSMIGRAAETAQREDEYGRPLPTSDLMGYGALGVVFGPLLIGDLLENYELRPAGPHGCLALTQQVHPKSLKPKHRRNKGSDEPVTARQCAEKIRIVNNITEMLITHWRDVVRHMKNLGALDSLRESRSYTRRDGRAPLRPSASQSFALHKPPNWDAEKISIRHIERNKSPTPSSRKDLDKPCNGQRFQPLSSPEGAIFVRKRRTRPKPVTNQMLPRSKSGNILSPTAEENQNEEGCEQVASAVEIDKFTAAPQEHGSQNIQFMSAEPYKAMTRFNLESPVAATKASSQLGQMHAAQGFSAIASEVITPKGTSEHGELPNNHSTIGEQNKIKALIKPGLIALEGRRHGGKGINQSPVVKRGTQMSKRQSTVSLQRKYEQHAQLGRGNPSLVPTGIVSSRLQGIKANGASDESPSGLRTSLKTENVRAPQHQSERVRKGYSPSFQSLRTDPLSKISHEEDVASLASLTEVIQSEMDTRDQVTPDSKVLTPPASPNSVHINRSESTASGNAQSEFRGRKHSRNYSAVNSFVIQVTPGRRTTSPVGRPKPGRTPRRSATESIAIGPRAATSVKALAARFNSDASLPPSLNTTPEQQPVPHSQFEPGVISPYTMNESPILRDHKLNKSDHSRRAAHKSVSIELFTSNKLLARTSPLVSKPLSINLPRQNESKPPQWPKLRPVTKAPPGRLSCASSPFQARSNLHRLLDGNVSSTSSRKSSLPVLQTIKHPPLAESSHIAKVQTPRKKQPASPFDISPFTLGEESPTSAEKFKQPSSIPRPRNTSASMMHSQMRQLQSQLKAKTMETEDLKRQLTAQRSFKASCELGEQLRRARRELEVWRHRAETAERRLDVLSHRARGAPGRDSTEYQTAVECVKSSISAIKEEKLSVDRMRENLGGEGGQHVRHRSESQGTVRRESSSQVNRSSSEMDSFSESKEHISSDSTLDESPLPFELE